MKRQKHFPIFMAALQVFADALIYLRFEIPGFQMLGKHTVVKLPEDLLHQGIKNILLIAIILIKGAVSDAGQTRYFFHPRRFESPAYKHLLSRFQHLPASLESASLNRLIF